MAKLAMTVELGNITPDDFDAMTAVDNEILLRLSCRCRNGKRRLVLSFFSSLPFGGRSLIKTIEVRDEVGLNAFLEGARLADVRQKEHTNG